jgi:hypothetical protein
MRYLQNVLLLIGSTSLGTVLGFFALAAVVASMQRPGGEPWTAGFGQYLGGMICGLPLGALTGLGLGIAFMRREQHKPWSGLVRAGILAGILAGPYALYRLRGDQAFSLGWWVIAVVSVVSGTLGGVIAGCVSVIWNAIQERRSARAPTAVHADSRRRRRGS